MPPARGSPISTPRAVPSSIVAPPGTVTPCFPPPKRRFRNPAMAGMVSERRRGASRGYRPAMPRPALDLVGFTPRQVTPDRTPNLHALGGAGPSPRFDPAGGHLPRRRCRPALCPPSTARSATDGGTRAPEVALWRQSNHLVEGEKIYEAARRRTRPSPARSCSGGGTWSRCGPVDHAAAHDFADGRKIPAIYSWPPEFGTEVRPSSARSLRLLGTEAGLPSSRWIADAAIRTLQAPDADDGVPSHRLRPPALRARRSRAPRPRGARRGRGDLSPRRTRREPPWSA